MNTERNFKTGHVENWVQKNFQQKVSDKNANYFQPQQFMIQVQSEKNLETVSARTKHVQRNCHVCSDSAIGNNFGAITCESCKAFFRRVRKLQEELVCPFKDNCEVNIKTRKFCQKCRFDKCVQMGMKVELLDVRRKAKLRRLKRAQAARMNASNGEKSGKQNFANRKTEFTNNQIVSATENASGTGKILSVHTMDETDPTSLLSQHNSEPEDTGIIFQFKMGSQIDWCKLPVVSADKRQDAPSNVVTNTSTQFISFPNTVQIATWKYCKMQELLMAKEAAQNEIPGACFSDYTSADFYHSVW